MYIGFLLKYLGEELLPEEVTNSLGVKPSKFKNKGDVIISKNGNTRVVKKSFWEWEMVSDFNGVYPPRNKTGFLCQLDDLIDKFDASFSGVYDKLNKQKNCEHMWIDIYIDSEDVDNNIIFGLSPKSTKILGKTGLLVDVTVVRL